MTLGKRAADKIRSQNNNRNRVVEEENVFNYEEETIVEEMDYKCDREGKEDRR